MSRLDQYNVTVSIDGTNYGTFDKMTGGAIDSEELKYRPGAMGAEISLGGPVTVSNITVSRLYVLNRDHGFVPAWKGKVGKGVVTVTKQPLDINRAPFGNPIVYSGTLKTLTLPEPDSEGTGSAGMIEMEITMAASVTA
jgi:hypothetical protein